MTNKLRLILMAVLLSVSACTEEVAQNIAPQDMTAETLGHYCQMNLLEHPGPKAQVHMKNMPAPLFFSQVRDAIAYARAPEQIAPILAIYVNDMGAGGATWEQPGDGNWIDAGKAFFVVGSVRAGGMGAPETVPFASRADAEAFVKTEGGTVLELSAITDDMVLTPVEQDPAEGGDADYEGRLRALPNAVGG
ncbi:nitrous oxide reductase accessory protein NosL [Aquamicrobium ahrensii]|uniref:Copper chaperone NosL n=1 Tax=Aquamicrobium ahrensii TaxID=469551 RepID=A0ABV2KMZ7_9HYPH